MESYTGTISPPGMYVKALYDYEADDRTSLSFRAGDIIRVLTQLESGWWDGVIRNVRGWFPSNYCVLVNEAEAKRLDAGEQPDTTIDETDPDLESDASVDDRAYEVDLQGYSKESASSHAARRRMRASHSHDGAHREQEEAAFWIPQATPDGRLYYFNTLTGVSTMELPLESPTSYSETGPRDGSRVFSSGESRPPPELLAAGLETEDDTDYGGSASEVDEISKSLASLPVQKRRSYLSDGASPSASTESLTNLPAIARTQTEQQQHQQHQQLQHQQISKTSFGGSGSGSGIIDLGSAQGLGGVPALAQRHFGDANVTPLTWNHLSDDMRKSVECYRQAINNSDRSDFVRRAEDVSDHLRLLLAAASGTTDNHSGHPSIISTNKALYPHFRDMMSRFSKLVLSSHIAAADWPAGDSYQKCLQEADGVLNAMYSFVEVARQQRGDEIPRMFPGFVTDQVLGANWQMNGLAAQDLAHEIALVDQDDYEPFGEPSVPLDANLLDRMDKLRSSIVPALRELELRLVQPGKIISHEKHSRMSDGICTACGKVLEQCKPWMAAMESIDLSVLRAHLHNPEVLDLAHRKQKIYNLVSELVIACQGVAAPLADEWQEDRGDSLEERVLYVRSLTKDLESSTLNINNRFNQLFHLLPRHLSNASPTTANSAHVAPLTIASPKSHSAESSLSPPSTSQSSYSHQATLSNTSASSQPGRSTFDDIAHVMQSSPPSLHGNENTAKLKQFFGEVPAVNSAKEPHHDNDDKVWYLRLDFEGEVEYDKKTRPPTIKRGTLLGLVEQLTRHDRYDAPFNNTFLLTYKSFTKAAQLFELLVKRWNIQPPPGLAGEDLGVWIDQKQALIRFRIVNVLKSWIETYWMEENDTASKELIQRIYAFAKDTIATSSTPGARSLILIIEQRMRGEDLSKKMIPTPNQETPPSILPKNLKKLKFLDIDATEFARQLTIIESRLYGKIKPRECLDKIWQTKMKPGEAEPAANVKSLILHSNRLTNWVAEMILTQTDLKKRVSVIKHFVSVADKCLSINNFSTLTSIISALGTSPIHRLARTWSQVNNRTSATLEKMRKLMGNTKNFAEYRETLHSANPPCIPFFGVYLTDLTFIEDGIPSKISKTNLINFSKRNKIAEVIREIQSYQMITYPYKSIPELQEYILSMMQSAGDVHEMYERSLQVEPREREDEKIARLLSESGFL